MDINDISKVSFGRRTTVYPGTANFHDILEEEIMNHRGNFNQVQSTQGVTPLTSERSHRKEPKAAHELKTLNAAPKGFAQQNAFAKDYTAVFVRKSDVDQASSSGNPIDSV